jgi:hypothetical protein
MPWSPKIVHLSNRVRDTETNENYFYPLYNAILTETFPEEDFAICPQFPVRPTLQGRDGSIDYAITYLIQVQDAEHDDTPVCFIEVKPPTDLRYPSAREQAATQIGERFRDLAVNLRISKLYGVSAIGRRIAYFSFDKGTRKIEPDIKKNLSDFIQDVAPIDWWDTNIMEDAGRSKFLCVVEKVKEMAHSL